MREVFLKENFSHLCTISNLRYVPSQKQLQNSSIIKLRGVYNTGPLFLKTFQVPG